MPELTDHQRISLRSFEIQTNKMHADQLQEMCLHLMAQIMHRENEFKKLLAHEWGLDSIGQFAAAKDATE